MSMNRIAKSMMNILIVVVISTLFIEIGLRLFDPLGVLALLRERAAAHWDDDPLRVYHSPPGVQYFLNGWSATTLPDTSRFVPDTNLESPCKIVLLGDSVTFGLELDDDQTWANLLSHDFPQVDIINAGTPGYDVWKIAATKKLFPANGYLYLLINDDALNYSKASAPSAPPFIGGTAIYYYWQFFQGRGTHYAEPGADFRQTYQELTADPTLITTGFDRGPGWLTYEVAQQYPVTLIKQYTHVVSVADPHPNADGAKEIEAQIKPIFYELVSRVCKG